MTDIIRARGRRDRRGRAAEAAVEVAAPRRQARAHRVRGDRPIQTVGRRKEAIVRVRIMPGTGKFTCNGRDARGVLPEQGAPAAHHGAAGDRREAPRRSTSSPTCAAAASPARPARCASASPGR